LRNIWISIKAIISSYLVSVIGILLITFLFSLTPLKGNAVVWLITNSIFAGIGGFLSALVTQKFRMTNSLLFGILLTVWTLYRIDYSYIGLLQIIILPLALLGGLCAIRTRKQVSNDQAI
jgi:hypothetical protein